MTQKSKGLFFIFSAPSGVGKSTVLNFLIEEDQNCSPSVSYTTRPAREGEIHGVHYFFVSREKFDSLEKDGFFIETTRTFHHAYATPLPSLEDSQQTDILFDLNLEGLLALKKMFPHQVVSIFLLPPSLTELERRLLKRHPNDLETVVTRMAFVQEEMQHYKFYDYVLVNDDLSKTFQDIKVILQAERLKKQKDFIELMPYNEGR